MGLANTCMTLNMQESATRLQVRKIMRKSRKWVLVMDDEMIMRQVICSMLEEKGYRTYGASNGEEAINSYMKARNCGYVFDAVILDLHVKRGKNGKEAMSDLLAVDPDVRAILATDDSADTIAVNFRAFGFREVLPKPFTPQQLDEAVQNVLDDKGRVYETAVNC